MTVTEKLYDLDSGLSEFECKITELIEKDGELMVVTDKTAFFPEGGGQSSDIGTLGGLYVSDVQIENERIMHKVGNYAENCKKVSVGDTVKGSINMKKRFSDMQQHSGEHIFSGIVHSLFGYDNVGFHLGESVTLDFNGILTDEDVHKVEKLVNKAVWDNVEIKVFYPSEDELAAIEYRSKKEINERLRLVEIPGIDICACCAPHVRRTGEIGLVEVVSFEKHRGGTRLSILCGERAIDDIRMKLDENKKVSDLLSGKETQTFSMVEKLKNDNAALSHELVQAKLETLRCRAETVEGNDVICVFCDLTDTNSIREYADILCEKASEFAAVFGGCDGAYKYVIISKSGCDVNSVCKKLNAAFSGRGGGRDGIVQGALSHGCKNEIETFIRKL